MRSCYAGLNISASSLLRSLFPILILFGALLPLAAFGPPIEL